MSFISKTKTVLLIMIAAGLQLSVPASSFAFFQERAFRINVSQFEATGDYGEGIDSMRDAGMSGSTPFSISLSYEGTLSDKLFLGISYSEYAIYLERFGYNSQLFDDWLQYFGIYLKYILLDSGKEKTKGFYRLYGTLGIGQFVREIIDQGGDGHGFSWYDRYVKRSIGYKLGIGADYYFKTLILGLELGMVNSGSGIDGIPAFSAVQLGGNLGWRFGGSKNKANYADNDYSSDSAGIQNNKSVQNEAYNPPVAVQSVNTNYESRRNNAISEVRERADDAMSQLDGKPLQGRRRRANRPATNTELPSENAAEPVAQPDSVVRTEPVPEPNPAQETVPEQPAQFSYVQEDGGKNGSASKKLSLAERISITFMYSQLEMDGKYKEYWDGRTAELGKYTYPWSVETSSAAFGVGIEYGISDRFAIGTDLIYFGESNWVQHDDSDDYYDKDKTLSANIYLKYNVLNFNLFKYASIQAYVKGGGGYYVRSTDYKYYDPPVVGSVSGSSFGFSYGGGADLSLGKKGGFFIGAEYMFHKANDEIHVNRFSGRALPAFEASMLNFHAGIRFGGKPEVENEEAEF